MKAISILGSTGSIGCNTLKVIEPLVMAGELMTKAAEKSAAEILPVDSEHNAIHQCLRGEKRSEVKRLILTASGGPFRESSKAEIVNATRDKALAHPNWRMGEKI